LAKAQAVVSFLLNLNLNPNPYPNPNDKKKIMIMIKITITIMKGEPTEVRCASQSCGHPAGLDLWRK
jgi:hypothetical protein